MPGPVFGHIPGYPLGSRFESRAELSEAGVHRHRQAGISGSASEGAAPSSCREVTRTTWTTAT